MLTRTQDFYIGVDGGGTKTHAIIVDRQENIFGEGRAGASNPVIVGLEVATQNILQAVTRALRQANISITQIASAYFGIAGVEHTESRVAAQDALKLLFPNLTFQLGTDARVALASATDQQAGVVIISGTGSIAFGCNSKGEEARAGGWGSTIGDEGSGFYIARRGLTAVAKAYDGRGPDTLITDILRQRADIRTAADLQRIISYPFVTNSDIAAYCGIVVEAARVGDLVAREILTSAGRELGIAVVAVIRRLGLESEAFTVAYVGGTFQAGELLIGAMRSVIEQVAPKAKLQKPCHSPAIGAARLAMKSGSLRKSA